MFILLPTWPGKSKQGLFFLEIQTLMHNMSERGMVMMMRRRLTPVNMREQGPGPVGSAGKNGWLDV